MFGLSRRPANAPGSGGRKHGAIRIPRYFTIAAILMLMPVSGRGQSNDDLFPFHSPAPAGYTVVLLQPSHAEVSILGVVECPEMEGAQKMSHGMRSYVVSAGGVALKHYPRQFSFRVTATLRKILLDGVSHTVETRFNARQVLLKLGFKLKIYHGLERREVFPQSVKLIGMPAEIPYDERVFRVSFEIENLPMSDRVVLEVLSPEDELLTHFTFGML